MSLTQDNFFSDNLQSLSNNNEFISYASEAIQYQQNSQGYSNYMEKKIKMKRNAIRRSIKNSIMDHFNKRNYNEFKTEDTQFTIYIGDLSEGDKLDLCNTMESKGYFCIIDEQDMIMTISSTSL